MADLVRDLAPDFLDLGHLQYSKGSLDEFLRVDPLRADSYDCAWLSAAGQPELEDAEAGVPCH